MLQLIIFKVSGVNFLHSKIFLEPTHTKLGERRITFSSVAGTPSFDAQKHELRKSNLEDLITSQEIDAMRTKIWRQIHNPDNL